MRKKDELAIIDVIGPITVGSSQQYDIIIKDSKDVSHFFFRKNGIMMYDGWGAPCDVEEFPVVPLGPPSRLIKEGDLA